MTRPPVSHRDKVAAILEAALEVFGRDGFAEGNVDDIALRAGVAKPTVYNRFGDKRALFIEAMKLGLARANERVLAVIQAMQVRPGNLRGELEALGLALVGCVASAEGSAVIRVQVGEGARFPELDGENQREQHLDLLAGKLAQIGAVGQLHIVDPPRAARQLMALVTADALALSGYGRKTLPADQLNELVTTGVDTFLAAFEPRPNARSPRKAQRDIG
ncbi:MAG: hypothetical protein JWQ65_2810 [Devosia sp.]|nr:hypothetical protein [Devosia sp.]